MKYYKVNAIGSDRYIRYGKRGSAVLYLVENELYTEKEKEKHRIPSRFVDEIEVPKNKTFFNFGCRFYSNV